MSELHILDVGRADCGVLLLDTPEGPRTVVVDGGGKLPRRPAAAAGVSGPARDHRRRPAHSDASAPGSFRRVRPSGGPGGGPPGHRACGDLRFADRVYPVFGDPEYYREYHTFFQYLDRSGTELLSSADCAGRAFSFGDYTLECLYPLPGSVLRSVTYARALCDPGLTRGAHGAAPGGPQAVLQ